MLTIFLTGAGGFVGNSIKNSFNSRIKYTIYKREDIISIKDNVVLHIAGKAHDLKNTSSSQEYYEVNTGLTKKVFDAFLVSEARIFITLSSVKAVEDKIVGELTEKQQPNPVTHYGKVSYWQNNIFFQRKFLKVNEYMY